MVTLHMWSISMANIEALQFNIIQSHAKELCLLGLGATDVVYSMLKKLPWRSTLLGVVDVKHIKCLKADINCPKQCALRERLTRKYEEALTATLVGLSQGQDRGAAPRLRLIQVFHHIRPNLWHAQEKRIKQVHVMLKPNCKQDNRGMWCNLLINPFKPFIPFTSATFSENRSAKEVW